LNFREFEAVSLHWKNAMPKRKSIIYDSSEFVKNFRSLTSTISEGVVITDEKENVVWVNKSFEKICGYTLEEMLGKKPKVLQGKDTDSNSIKAIRDALANKKTIDSEILNYRPDGTPYWVKITITPVLNEKNDITNFIAFEHDITEEKKKALEIEESEKLYKNIFEKNPEIMFIFDPKTYKILEANETALKVYGYTKNEFLKLTIKDLRPKGDWNKVKKILPKVKDDFIMQGVWKHLKKSGEIIFVEVKASRTQYKGREAILVIPTDVTEKVKSDEEIKLLNEDLHKLNNELIENLNESVKLHNDLKANNEKLNQIRNAAKIGIWELNLNTLDVNCSEEVWNIFEVSKDDKHNLDLFTSIVHKEDVGKFTEGVAYSIKNKTPLDIEYKIALKGGRHKHLVSKGAVVYDEKGSPEIISGITLDITEKKHNEELIARQLKNINIILGSITDPFYIIDKNYKLLFINDVSLKLSGLKRDNVIGKSIWDVYPELDFEQEKREYAKALKSNKSVNFETEYFGRAFSVTVYPSEIGLAVSAKDITENIKIMNELKDKAKFIQEIGDSTPGGIIQTVYSKNGKVELRYISAGFEDLWGISTEEVKKNPNRRFEAIHPEDKETVKKELFNSVKNLAPVNHKFRYINKKNGEIKWVRANTVPTKMSDGSVMLNGVFLDITESQKYYEELEKSNERYNYVSLAAREGIWDLDFKTGIVQIGGNYADIMKGSRDVTSLPMAEFVKAIHPEDSEKVLKSFDAVLKNRETNLWEETFRLLNFAGETVHVLERGYVIRDVKTKEPLRFVGSTFDITDRVKYEESLKEKADFIQSISDNVPGAIFEGVIYPDGIKILYLSEGFEKFTGIPNAEIIKDPSLKLKAIHPDDVGEVTKQLTNAGNSKGWNMKLRYINQKSGEIFYASFNAAVTKQEDESIKVTGVVIDISDTEKYYREQEKSNRRYEYVSKATNETIWEWDLKTNIIEVGGNYKEMFGEDFPDNKVTFDYVYSRMHPDDLDIVRKSIQYGLKDYENHFRETSYRMFRKDGSTIYVSDRSYTIFDPVTKEPLKIIGSTVDITEKKKYETSLKEQAQFIKHISDNIPGGIFESIYYPDGKSKLVYASEGFEELWGIPVEKVMENPELRFLPIHEDDIEFTHKEIKDSIENLKPLNIKFRFVNQKTGNVSWIRSKCLTAGNEDGSTILYGLMIDVTDTEKYYKELEDSNKRFEYLSKASNEIIWDMDLKTMVTTLGGNYENILGCSFPDHKADLETRKSFVHPEDVKRLEEFIAMVMRDKVKSFWEVSYRIISREGKIFHVYEKGYIIHDQITGEPIRAIGSTLDITDKKKAEDESKEHAKFLKEISDSMDGFIFQTVYDNDFNAKLNYASEKAKDYWGVTVEEAKKDYFKTAENVFYEDRAKLNELRLNAVKNLTVFDHKFRYYNIKKGGLRWVRAVAVPSRLSDGNTIFNGIVTDVTETEKFYNELEKSNQRYEYVSKAANEAIWDLDLHTNMFTFGGSYKEMLGYELENDTCHNDEVIQMTHPEDREKVHASIEEVMKDKNKNYWEDYYRMIKKDGGIVHVYDRGFVIRDEKTFEPLRFVGVTQDITQQKLYEEALEEQVRKINVIIESLTDPFFVISKDMKVIIANSSALKLAGKMKEEIIGKNIYDFTFVQHHNEVFNLFKESIEKNKTIHEDFKMGEKWYDILLYPSSIGLAVYSKDITEKKNRQEELQKNAKFISEISESTPGFLFQLEFDKNLKPKLNYASEKAEEFWGITAKAAMEGSEELFTAVHEEDKIPFITSLKESVSKLHNLNIKYRLINRLTNVPKWVRAAAIPSRLENGHTLLSGTVIDITEAEQYYNQLEQANERYENVSNAINNAIWELDIRTGICVMGGAYEQMYGYKLKDNILTDEFHKKILHPDDYEEITKAKAEALSDKNNRRWERTYRIIRADGEIIYVNDRAYIVYDEKTQMPVKIIGSTQDITDKVKYDAEQQKNQKFLKEISDSIDGFVFQLEFDKNKKPRLNYMSEKAEHFTGDNVKEALEGRTTVFSSIYEEDLPLFKEAISESIKKLTPLNIKFRHANKKTNEIFTVRASALPTLLENGNTILNGVVIDITESENYYNKLEELTRRYEYISKASNETIWEMDVKSQEVILGGGYREMFGTEFPGNKITYSQWQGFVHQDDLEKIEKSMYDTIVNGNNKYWESNFRIVNKNKKVIDVFERAFIVYDEKTNAPIKIIGSTQDITQINKMRAERENMIDDLVNRNKALEQFTYMVSHNLRAPIANILGISYLLEDNPDEKTQTEMHQLIKESSSKLDSVIRDMNEILSIKKGYDEEKTEVRFEDVLNEIKETEKELINKSGVQIVSDFIEAASIQSVKGYLYSIFHNLISNGIKYRNGAIPNIKITSKTDDKFVYLSFEDNGIGIDLEKNAGKIFGLYSKFHLNKEGKGMGLFMVKNQVESLGGEIKVRSKVNEGTTFTIKFKK
jgi:PAS domain S-box-containing protein